ncbi:MAG: hypothetical protein JSU68_14410 [Phycisphaerales bacterium]|nr:MAG: hypothetical protein JSU68_14410 [Phycisphaerales bacterium]
MSPVDEVKAEPRWVAYVAWASCVVAGLVYLVLKQYSYRCVPGDENIYYYMAKVMAEGKAWPYRDFFFAHPPLQLFVAAAVFKAFGASYVVARSLPIFAGLASGLAVFGIGYRRLGPLEGAAAQAAFLLGYDVLRASSHYTGANLGLALLLWGCYCLLRRRDVAGGLLLGLSAQTVVYAVPGVIMALLWRFAGEPRRALRAIVAAAGVYLLVSVACLVLGGAAYTEAVFRYHLMKEVRSTDKVRVFSRMFLLHNFYLAWAPIVGAAALAWWRRGSTPAAPARLRKGADGEPSCDARTRKGARRDTSRERRRSPGAQVPGAFMAFLNSRPGFVLGLQAYVVGYAAFFSKLREWYEFYFLMVFAPLALLAAYVVGEIGCGLRVLCDRTRWLLVLRSLTLCGVVAIGYGFVKHSLRDEYPNAADRRMEWFDAPPLGAVNTAVRKALWREERGIDRDYLGLTHYLWHEMRHLEEVRGAAAYVRKHSRPDDRLFGESGLAPLVAFLSDRDLVGFVADTNTKRISSGQLTVDVLARKIDVPELRFVFASRQRGKYLYVNKFLQAWLEGHFTEAYTFQSRTRPGVTWMLLERMP